MRTDRSTFFPASIEDSHVLQIHTQAAPYGQGLARVSLEATSDRAIRVRPETAASCFRMLRREASCDRLKVWCIFCHGVFCSCLVHTFAQTSRRTFVAAPFHRQKINTMAH